MTPAEVCREVYGAGLAVRVGGDRVRLGPAELITSELRALVVDHKPELIQFLADAEVAAGELVAAAMRCCDHWRDDKAARDQMRKECMDTPPHLRAELLAHFQAEYLERI